MISLRCPECSEPIDSGTHRCVHDHLVRSSDGIIELFSVEFRKQLVPFLQNYHKIYKSQSEDWSNEEHKNSPFVFTGSRKKEWAYRRLSLQVVMESIANKRNQSILEIGPWNGWLSHHLAKAGHAIVAVDYFREEPYGLQAVKKNSPTAICIQTNLQDLSLIAETFDLIVVNHCLQFMPDPRSYANKLKEKLNAGGVLLVIGSPVFLREKRKVKSIREKEISWRKQHGVDLYFQAGKGYLNHEDLKQLQKSNFKFTDYPGSGWKNVVAKIIGLRPLYLSGKYDKPAH